MSERKAVVTGAANGIGKAIAHELAAHGAHVFLLDRDRVEGEAACAAIVAAGGRCEFRELDVTRADQIADVASAILADVGYIDILVNNAGIWRPGTVVDASEATWDAVLDTNVKSVFLVSRQFVPAMLERKRGVIANVASVAGMVGAADASAYAASKGAVINLTRSMALDFAAHNVRVNCVCPGMMDTQMGDAVVAHYRPADVPEASKQNWQPLRRAGEPDDVAKAVLYMVSDDARFMTGSAVVVDGGLTAQ
ncbi:SDR family NAD(P)-dependent oxidoreductase [Pararobbsia silviterrae]|uniref:SDR family NAD(P)-dependent oxidoreductase n=1 Tax=Pararobbsia silviterrae TaxID=1792498 RepID=UPI0013141D74|nr:SDR family oxidoreductase [Pararobbsia silviterrae]